jgi:hypothetical protein
MYYEITLKLAYEGTHDNQSLAELITEDLHEMMRSDILAACEVKEVGC